MREPCCVWLSAADRARLATLVADRNSPQKHVWRAQIVLLSADRVGTVEIMRRTGKAKPGVWRWQARYLEAGVDGLWRDRTRPSRIPRLAAEVVERVVARTLAPPPGEATHWTVRAMARDSGISPASVQRIWAAHGLQPHRVRTFKLSNDPAFAAKLRDVVGLYVDPPAHAIVLSIDEKSQIQALDRTQPGLPMKNLIIRSLMLMNEGCGTAWFCAGVGERSVRVSSWKRRLKRQANLVKLALGELGADVIVGAASAS